MRLENRKKTEIAFPVICAVLIVAAAHIVFMLFSGKGLLDSNPYNSYVRQAIAWSQGQLYLPENYPWLELAIYEGHYYVSFPPFPSYLLFPFALIFGMNTPESIIAFCVMLIGVFYAVRIAKHCGLDDFKSILLATFLYCANNVWMVTVDAWVWFFAQNLAFTLTLMSLYYGLTGKFGRSFFFLAAAVGCRPFQIVYSLIILCWLFKEELSSTEKIKSFFLPRIHRFVPALLLGISYMVLNVLRFDNPFEFGHNYLPEFLEAENGQFSITYLKDNLPRLFELPAFDPDTKKLVFQRFNGTCIFIVFPIFIILTFSLIKLVCRLLKRRSECGTQDCINIVLPLVLVCIHILLLCAHKTMGGAHFGNRYIIDVIPAVYLVLAKICSAGENTITAEINKSRSIEGMIFFICYIAGLLINFIGVMHSYTQM